MSEPIKLVAFCGSLRKASFNRLALQAFAERLPAGAACETIEIDWPLYSADIQAQGFPAAVQAANQKVLAARLPAPIAGVVQPPQQSPGLRDPLPPLLALACPQTLACLVGQPFRQWHGSGRRFRQEE